MGNKVHVSTSDDDDSSSSESDIESEDSISNDDEYYSGEAFASMQKRRGDQKRRKSDYKKRKSEHHGCSYKRTLALFVVGMVIIYGFVFSYGMYKYEIPLTDCNIYCLIFAFLNPLGVYLTVMLALIGVFVIFYRYRADIFCGATSMYTCLFRCCVCCRCCYRKESYNRFYDCCGFEFDRDDRNPYTNCCYSVCVCKSRVMND